MKKSVFALFLAAAAPLCAELLPAEIGLGWKNGDAPDGLCDMNMKGET